MDSLNTKLLSHSLSNSVWSFPLCMASESSFANILQQSSQDIHWICFVFLCFWMVTFPALQCFVLLRLYLFCAFVCFSGFYFNLFSLHHICYLCWLILFIVLECTYITETSLIHFRTVLINAFEICTNLLKVSILLHSIFNKQS